MKKGLGLLQLIAWLRAMLSFGRASSASAGSIATGSTADRYVIAGASKTRGVLLATTGVILLVPTALLIRLMPSFPVDALMFWRAIPQSLGLTFFALCFLRARYSLSPLLWFMGTVYAVETCSFVFSISHTYVANTLLFASTAPLWAAFGGWLLWRERLSLVTFASITLCMVGLAIFVYDGLGRGSFAGDAAGALSALAISIFFLCSRRIRSGEAVLAVGIGASFVCLLTFPAALSFGLPPSGEIWPLVVTLAIQPFGMSFLALSARHIPAAEVALILLLETVLSPILVWLVVGELPPSATFIGGGLSFLAIIGWCVWQLQASLRVPRSITVR